MNQHRNVLNRAERIEILANEDKFDKETGSPMGLPKVGSRKIKIASKKKAESEESEETEGGSEVSETTEVPA